MLLLLLRPIQSIIRLRTPIRRRLLRLLLVLRPFLPSVQRRLLWWICLRGALLQFERLRLLLRSRRKRCVLLSIPQGQVRNGERSSICGTGHTICLAKAKHADWNRSTWCCSSRRSRWTHSDPTRPPSGRLHSYFHTPPRSSPGPSTRINPFHARCPSRSRSSAYLTRYHPTSPARRSTHIEPKLSPASGSCTFGVIQHRTSSPAVAEHIDAYDGAP